MNTFIWAHGGFGDVAWSYLFNENWGRLTEFKKQNIENKIKAIIISYNTQSLELIRFNPYIDEIEFRSPNWEQRDLNMSIIKIAKQYAYGYKQCTEVDGFNKLRKSQPYVYLNPYTEETTVNNIICKGPFIIIHPFASDESRQIKNDSAFKEIINYIRHELKYNVVIFGNTHQKIIGKDKKINKENLSIEGNKIFNLIDKTTSRVSLRLLQNSIGCIGTWSCWTTLSWGLQKPTILITDEKNKKGINFVVNGKYKSYKLPSHYNIFTKNDIIPEKIYDYLGKIF